MFLVNPPIIVVLIIAIRRCAAHRHKLVPARLDVAGAVLATTSIASLIYGLSEGQQYGFSTAQHWLPCVWPWFSQ